MKINFKFTFKAFFFDTYFHTRETYFDILCVSFGKLTRNSGKIFISLDQKIFGKLSNDFYLV